MPIDAFALSVLYVQLMRDLFAIAKFLFLTVKYAKECWVSVMYKITLFNTSHCMRSISSHSD